MSNSSPNASADCLRARADGDERGIRDEREVAGEGVGDAAGGQQAPAASCGTVTVMSVESAASCAARPHAAPPRPSSTGASRPSHRPGRTPRAGRARRPARRRRRTRRVGCRTHAAEQRADPTALGGARPVPSPATPSVTLSTPLPAPVDEADRQQPPRPTAPAHADQAEGRADRRSDEAARQRGVPRQPAGDRARR